MGGLVYFLFVLGNMVCFVVWLGLMVVWILILFVDVMFEFVLFYVLILLIFVDGEGCGVVFKQVICFLNDLGCWVLLCGVIVVGNWNFGVIYVFVGCVIVEKCNVLLFYSFELVGIDNDIVCVYDGFYKFWGIECLMMV